MAPSPETLLSILTTERWTLNGLTSFLVFHPDGTGHILLGGDIGPYFARGFNWKALNVSALGDRISVPTSNRTRTLAYLSLEIMITDRDPLPDYSERFTARTTYDDLNEEGVRPKTYTVRLESGRFSLPYLMDLYGREDFNDSPSRLRLVFDKSPYRPHEEWKGNRGFLDDMKRDPIEFVGRYLSSEESSWDSSSCVVN